MNVLVLTNLYPTAEKPWWGTFVAEQVHDLRAFGVNVDVLDFDGTERRSEYVRAARRFRRTLRTMDHDLVHAHYGLTGAIAVGQRRLPVVTTFHGGDYNGITPWHARVSRIVARHCTPIVVTDAGAQALGVPNATVIPAGIDTRLFQPGDRRDARRALGLDPDLPYALLLGSRNDPVKRADVFDEAVAHARRHSPELKTLSLDRVTRQEVALLMNAASVAVLTSDTEGLPVAVREALASMTPVVSVAVGSVPEVLAGLDGCTIAERDPAALGDAIAGALTLDRLPAWRARAEETSGTVVAGRLAELYEAVVNSWRHKHARGRRAA